MKTERKNAYTRVLVTSLLALSLSSIGCAVSPVTSEGQSESSTVTKESGAESLREGQNDSYARLEKSLSEAREEIEVLKRANEVDAELFHALESDFRDLSARLSILERIMDGQNGGKK